jgi:hypothetical protein
LTTQVHLTVTNQGSPLWLTFITLGISLIAVIISLWQAFISNSERKSNRPDIEVRASYDSHVVTGPNNEFKAVLLYVHNKGREATNILSFRLQTPTIVLVGPNNLIYGPKGPWPYRLNAYSAESWGVNAEGVDENNVTVHIDFGHGPSMDITCQLDERSP